MQTFHILSHSIHRHSCPPYYHPSYAPHSILRLCMQAHPKTKGKSVSSTVEDGQRTARGLKLAALSTLALGAIALGLATTMWFATGAVRRGDPEPCALCRHDCIQPLTSPGALVGKAPDFGRYRPLDTLEADEFPIGENLSLC